MLIEYEQLDLGSDIPTYTCHNYIQFYEYYKRLIYNICKLYVIVTRYNNWFDTMRLNNTNNSMNFVMACLCRIKEKRMLLGNDILDFNQAKNGLVDNPSLIDYIQHHHILRKMCKDAVLIDGILYSWLDYFRMSLQNSDSLFKHSYMQSWKRIYHMKKKPSMNVLKCYK